MKTFNEAKAEAIDIINKLYDGNKMNCCIVETKLTMKSKESFFGFRFNSYDTFGEFVPQSDGTFARLTKI